MRELTISIEENVYEILKPMVSNKTVGQLFSDFVSKSAVAGKVAQKNALKEHLRSLRGTLTPFDLSDIRDETDRVL